MRILNLGVLAHVDAGKTSLTERLLYTAGAIDKPGRVDDGSTQTDTLALERQRGITIRSAVVSFVVGDVTVNLIDTPGHPDFIAEVERVLNVLDGVVLVISAVEGVQPQTRVLMRTLQRLNIPTLLFINKIDRPGANCEAVVEEICAKLTPAVFPIGSVRDPGSRDAAFVPHRWSDPEVEARLLNFLTEHDEALLNSYVENEDSMSLSRLRRRFAAASERALVHPIVFGSAITGAGVDSLIAVLDEFLPARAGNADGPVSGAVFKVERGAAGEKVAYLRLFSGRVSLRDRLHFGQTAEGRVTAIEVFERGSITRRTSVVAGQIARLWGLADVRVGDAIGAGRSEEIHYFAPPTLETVVRPRDPAAAGAMHVALSRLAEQDPLINVRHGEQHDLIISLYGEVQKEVIEATLANDFGVEAEFRESTPIYVERPIRSGSAGEVLRAKTPTNVTGASSPTSPNPHLATLGLRIDPAPPGSGTTVRLNVDVKLVPLYIYKTVAAFVERMTEYVRETLLQGPRGWQVIDCVVTIVDCGYRAPGTTALDFRRLTPLVLMPALEQAGTAVCEPIHRFRLEAPSETLGSLLPVLARVGAVPGAPTMSGSLCVIEGDIAAARVHELQKALPALAHGEGSLEHVFDRYDSVRGEAPSRYPRP